MSSTRKQVFKQIWAIFWPLKWRIAIVLLLIAVNQGLNLVGPYVQGQIIDKMTQQRSFDEVLILIYWTAGIWLTSLWLTGYLRERHEVKRVDFDIDSRIGDRTMGQVLSLSIGQHNAQHSGLKQSVINRGQHSLNALVFMFIYDIIPTFTRIILMTIAMIWLIRALGLIVLGALLIFLIMTYLTNHASRKKLKISERMWNQESKFRNEILCNVSHVLANAQEDKARTEADAKYGEVVAMAKPIWLKFILFGHEKGTIITLAKVLILGLGAHYVYGGQYSIGTIVIFWAWSNMALDGLWHIGGLHRQIMKMWTSIVRYCEFMNIESDIKIPANPIVLAPVKGLIELKNVSFRYQSRMLVSYDTEDDPAPIEREAGEQSALEDVSLTIQPGEMIAIVGESGSGKTTLAGLLIRANDPTSGQILIDGHDLRSLDLHSYRSQIGIVEQDVPLFDRSIRDNILYGIDQESISASDQDIEKIAQISQINRFTHKLESGFDTLIGERGIKLSGGERQRVGIARALIKNPSILIFDEATSSLDAAVEAEIRDAIREASRGRTTVIIAHRFSTIRYANRIIVMDNGRIVGQGTHKELYASCETYKKLVDHQIAQIDGVQ
ncbi:MAG: hypothetical protein A3B99_03805 [Candidatus Yanofskybacteria bacterium RIFCSPHIGHO2_02_FULL_44_12b]|uniref:ABC transporter n=1 Tax=Candidatus Yanofskybacteria bacterium RIFCSPLOWO2_01_FULL_44_22 TaxID=1802697 RepID=A0A1F8GNY2_9BACT|nr:MAG: hypothetical protein A2659_01035 [Candidatus Yanofskybacteria bacterium RIFCSPHIGHO2_01_FULL_44_24]OGN15645.1 MAG: hypothetical protein A3B99_03805 [Candidatus Yanofskybacteria bacterium RIFCSPHIGHO2_02_FULL_44_12b]OGN26700.1 MAG: hypothetical protein A2925_03890 [Candidatus Yanofskybacteria bacterium RIFCSPLOWO2_01_FULL_44_22]